MNDVNYYLFNCTNCTHVLLIDSFKNPPYYSHCLFVAFGKYKSKKKMCWMINENETEEKKIKMLVF